MMIIMFCSYDIEDHEGTGPNYSILHFDGARSFPPPMGPPIIVQFCPIHLQSFTAVGDFEWLQPRTR